MQTNEKLLSSLHLLIKEPGEGQPSKIENLNNNCFIPAKHQGKQYIPHLYPHQQKPRGEPELQPANSNEAPYPSLLR